MIRQKNTGLGPDVIQKSNGFGLDIQVNRSPLPKMNHLPIGDTSGTPDRAPLGTGYRRVIPPGEIGSEEGVDPQLPPPQYVDTVASYPTEQNDPRLHGSMAALRSADTQSLPLKTFGDFQPRSAPIPRAAQDDMFLNGYGDNAADPLMTDRDSNELWPEGRHNDGKDLYGKNRDGVLHNPIGSYPTAPMSPSTNRNTSRSPRGKRPPELADGPLNLGKVKA
jgi:hypothetical protein